MAKKTAAYDALHGLAQKSLASAQPLPAQTDVTPQWNGVGFSLLGIDFVMPMSDLAEMLEVPVFTKLPGVQTWVKGIANVRGRLLPVYDMPAYFGGSIMSHRKQQRLLVIDKEKFYAGLWVDSVYGMQYFPMTSRVDHIPASVPDVLQACIRDAFLIEGHYWLVFDMAGMIKHQGFLDVAIG